MLDTVLYAGNMVMSKVNRNLTIMELHLCIYLPVHEQKFSWSEYREVDFLGQSTAWTLIALPPCLSKALPVCPPTTAIKSHFLMYYLLCANEKEGKTWRLCLVGKQMLLLIFIKLPVIRKKLSQGNSRETKNRIIPVWMQLRWKQEKSIFFFRSNQFLILE